MGLVVEVVERGVEVAHRRPQPHEHRDAGRDEDGGEDEAEPVTGRVSHEGGRLSHPSGKVRGMCRMCEGLSQEDVFAEESAIIEKHGYLVTGVGAGEPTHWAYTVGLLDRADHPELIVAGPPFEIAGATINHVGRQILEGTRFDVGDTVVVPEGELFECETTLRVGAVDPIQYRLGTFNVWFALADHGAVRSEELRAVQLIAPPDVICGCGRCEQPDLARPESRVGVAPLEPPAVPARRRRRGRR